MTFPEPDAHAENERESRRDALDEVVINELARGRTYEEAATAAGWSSRTVARRMRDPQFRRRVSELRSVWVSELSGRLVDSGSTAIDVIVQECRIAERSADRLRAAGMLLNVGLLARRSLEPPSEGSGRSASAQRREESEPIGDQALTVDVRASDRQSEAADGHGGSGPRARVLFESHQLELSGLLSNRLFMSTLADLWEL